MPHDAPESLLRRSVLLTFSLDLDAGELQRQLEASGLFTRVSRMPEQPQPIRWASDNTEPFGNVGQIRDSHNLFHPRGAKTP